MLNQQIFDKIFFYNVKKKEVVTLIYENSKSNIIKYFKKYDNKINYFNLDDHGKRPLKKIPDEIVECIKKTDILFFFSDKYSDKNLDEYLTIRKPLIELKNENSLLRIGMLLSTNLNLFKNIFKYDPNEVKRLNKKIIKLLNEKNTSEIIIKTSSGTDLIIETSKKYNWINQDADLKKLSEQHSLLAGEVYGYPEKINGILVVNGSMGGTFSKYDLSKNPLTLSIKNGLWDKSLPPNLLKQ